mgnify:CR=1 FL=1
MISASALTLTYGDRIVLDAEAEARFDAYSAARDRMLDETDRGFAPWTVVATDDKKTARLNIIRHILKILDHCGEEIAARAASRSATSPNSALNWGAVGYEV